MTIFGIIMMLVWIYITRNISMGNAEKNVESGDKEIIFVWGLISFAGLIPIFITIFLHGTLRDGILTWLPSLVNEKFGLSETSSILGTAVLPILSMVSVLISNAIYHKIKNEIKTAAIMFGMAFTTMLSGCMCGVKHMLISLFPKNSAKLGMVSAFSGVLNAFTYVGASISSYGFAAIADFRG